MVTLHSVRVLVLNDDPHRLALLAAPLRARGASVLAAPSVRDALVGFVTAHPAVVVSDLCTPVSGGMSLIREVRALARLSGTTTRALGITTATRAADRDEALRAGFDDLLVAPVDPDDLCAKIAALIAH